VACTAVVYTSVAYTSVACIHDQSV
jgi:hypothetical protein